MPKEIIAIVTAALLVASTTPTNAQTSRSSKYFFSDFFKGRPSDCQTSYPVPIGTIPSRQDANLGCLPPPIAIIPGYGKIYAQLMRRAIQAGVRGDYDSALIHFRRAHLIEISKNHLGYSNREALRGIQGALVAKRYRKNPHPSKRLTPEFFWYYWTGTGDRGNWGRNFERQ